MLILTVCLVILTTFCIKWYLQINARRSKLPHGPFPLPLIGNLHLLIKDIHLSMDRLSLSYGNMYTLWMAHIPYIVVTDSDIARKICITTNFADRLPLYVGDQVYTRGSKDIIMADYTETLKIHRKLAHKAIQTLGGDGNILEKAIMTNVKLFVEKLENYSETKRTVLICEDITLACFNTIATFVFGDIMEETQYEYIKMKEAIFLMMQSGVTLSPINFYPILRFLPNRELNEMLRVLSLRDSVLKMLVDKAEKKFDNSELSLTYTEALLKARKHYENQDDIDKIFSRDHIEMNIFDMFLGGVESTATTLSWAVMYMIKWPELQCKAQNEIDRIMEQHENSQDMKGNIVELKHKHLMPYIQAIIYETFRLASPLPFGVFHKARVDTEINGYKIPKGLATMINLWTIHHKEEYFAEPYKFKPERFLDDNGQIISLSSLKHFFPFSVGPRECIGKEVGKNELFLFLANLLYNFNIETCNKNKTLDLHGTTKVTHAPKPYYVIIKRRKKV